MQQRIQRLLQEVNPPHVKPLRVQEIVSNLDRNNLKFRLRDMESELAQASLIDLTVDEPPIQDRGTTPEPVPVTLSESTPLHQIIKLTTQKPALGLLSPVPTDTIARRKVALTSSQAKRPKLAVPSSAQKDTLSISTPETRVEVTICKPPQTTTMNTADSIDEIWKAHWKWFLRIHDKEK